MEKVGYMALPGVEQGIECRDQRPLCPAGRLGLGTFKLALYLQQESLQLDHLKTQLSDAIQCYAVVQVRHYSRVAGQVRTLISGHPY